MSEKMLCPKCGQPLPPVNRACVWLPALKGKIFDFIDRHAGITAEGIAYHVGVKPNTVRQHIWQINELLAATDVRIICDRAKWAPGDYRVTRSKNDKPQKA